MLKGLIVIYFTVIYLYFKTKASTKDNYSERNVKLPSGLIIIYFTQYFLFAQPSPGPSEVNGRDTH